MGLNQSGLKGVLAIERDPMAFSTLEHNLLEDSDRFEWPNWFPRSQHEIRESIQKYGDKLSNLMGQVDLIVGGPPCQGFSTAGRRMAEDDRNSLFKDFVKFVDLVKPSIVLFENVPGFSYRFQSSTEDSRTHLSLLNDELTSIGYSRPEGMVFDFSKFGVPQTRKRLIICSTNDGQDPKEILSQILDKQVKSSVRLEEAISDLKKSNGLVPSPDSPNFSAGRYGASASDYQAEMRDGFQGKIPDSHRFAHHRREVEDRYRAIQEIAPRGRNIEAEMRKSLGLKKRSLILLSKSDPSPTLTTLPDDYVHYDEPRILTVREYARIQSFPDWFEFKGKYTTGGEMRVKEVPRYSQVANAVAPKFSQAIGSAVRRLLS